MAVMITPNQRRSFVAAMVLVFVMAAGVGCQTFTMSDEDFQKQQHGEMVDPDVGNAVGVTGTVAYYGAMVGVFVSQLLK
jgi:nitrate/nitrite transporter NarK